MSNEHNQQYFGYTTDQNTQLMQYRQNMYRLRAHMPPEDQQGMDPAHYDNSQAQQLPLNPDTPTPGADSPEYKSHGLWEQIMARVNGANADGLQKVGDDFQAISTILTDLAKNITDSSNALYNGDGGGGWQSPAADAFMMKGPGATLKSINDWQTAADQNSMGMYAVASAVRTAQSQINGGYPDYVQKVNQAIYWLKRINMTPADGGGFQIQIGGGGSGTHMIKIPGLSGTQYRPSSDNSVTLYDNQGNLSDYSSQLDWMAEKKNQFVGDAEAIAYYYSRDARTYESTMATSVSTAMSNYLYNGTSTKYEGPEDAVRDDPMEAQVRRFNNMRNSVPSGPPSINTNALNNQQKNLQQAQDQQKHLQDIQNQQKHLQEIQNQQKQLQQLQQQQHQLQQLQQQVPNPAQANVQTPPNAPTVDPALLAANAQLAANAANLGNVPVAPSANGLNAQANGLTANQAAFNKPSLSRPNLSSPESMGNRPPANTGFNKGKVLGNKRLNRPQGMGNEEGEGAGRTGNQRPMSPGMNKKKQDQGLRPGSPGNLGSEELGSMPNRPSTSPVLDGKRMSRPSFGTGEGEEGGRLGSTRPGSNPSVLNNRARKDTKGGGAEQQYGYRTEELATPKEPGAIAPIIDGRAAQLRPGAPTSFEEVPTELRGARGLGSDAIGRPASRPTTEAELTGRRQQQPAEKKKFDPSEAADYQEFLEMRQQLRGEEAWTVETPGGPVIASQPEQPVRREEAGPMLGAL